MTLPVQQNSPPGIKKHTQQNKIHEWRAGVNLQNKSKLFHVNNRNLTAHISRHPYLEWHGLLELNILLELKEFK